MMNADYWSCLVSKGAAKLSAELGFVEICREFAPAATHSFLNLSNTSFIRFCSDSTQLRRHPVDHLCSLFSIRMWSYTLEQDQSFASLISNSLLP